MAKKKKTFFIKTVALLILCLTISCIVMLLWYKNWQTKFDAPRKNTQSIEFTIGKDKTLAAVISDLHYFGFIKDEGVFQYALEHTKDNTPGNEKSLKIGLKTIDREARYTISQSITAWQIADILLNKSISNPCDHGCPVSSFNPELLPGGDLAPTMKQKYSWIKTYEECVGAIGHDGGQLSSEQYFQKTGIRRCVSPDGREFTKGKTGWSDFPTP